MRYLFQQQMPFSRGLKREILYIIVSGICAVIIFYIARPLGFSNLGDLTLLGFGLVSMITAILYLLLTHYLFNQFWSGRKWTLAFEITHSILFLFFIASGIMIYGQLMGVTDLSFKTASLYFVYTFLLGIIPVIIRAVLVRNWRLKTDLVEVKKLNDLLRNKEAEVDEKVIEFPISKKESLRVTNQSLLYIESKENYLSVYWQKGQEIKNQLIRMTMKDAIRIINDPFIVFCHRSFMVNLRKVKEVASQDGGSVIAIKGVEKAIPLSNSFKTRIKERLREL